MFGSHIMFFPKITLQVIKLHCRVALTDVVDNSFPLTHANGFEADCGIGIFPIQIFVFFLAFRFAKQAGKKLMPSVSGQAMFTISAKVGITS